jgi:hypothetical protein
MTEGVASEVGAVGRAGATQRQAATSSFQPVEGQRESGAGGAERSGWTDRSELAAGRPAGLPRLAGRIKRRPERARPPAAPYAAVLEVDAELCQAAKGVARLRLELGQAIELLVRQSGLFELGYSDLRSYALQRCWCSGRWAEDTRTVATRLGALPALRAALVVGEVNWSMAELVARHATTETEGELTEQAKQLTVRQMRQQLADGARRNQQSGQSEEQSQAQNDGPASGTQERAQQRERETGPQGQDPPCAEPGGDVGAEGEHAGNPWKTVATESARGGRAQGENTGDTQPSDKRCDKQNSEEAAGVVVGTADGSEFVTVELESWPGFPDLDQIDPMRTLTITLDREVAWLFEGTRMLVELLGGQSSTDALLECMLGEALTSLPDSRAGTCALFEQYAAQEAVRRAWLEEQAAMREEADRLCEKNVAALLGLRQAQPAPAGKGEAKNDNGARLGPEQAQPTPKGEAEPESDSTSRLRQEGTQEAPRGQAAADSNEDQPREPASISELDSRIGELAQLLTQSDLRIGQLADKLHQVQGWNRLGFASETQYARERLGMARSSLRAKRVLARQLRSLPVVRSAVQQGAIGFDAAVQLAKVVTEKTEQPWVERAKRRTAKHLREEVELCEMVVRRTGRRACLPPTEEQMQRYFELERAVTSGRGLVDASVAEQERRAGATSAAQDTDRTADQQRSAATEAALGFQPDSDAAYYPSATLAVWYQMSRQQPATATAGCEPGAAGAAQCQMSGQPQAGTATADSQPSAAEAAGCQMSGQPQAATASVDSPPGSTGAAQCQMSGEPQAAARARSARACSWDSHLVALAALVRAHLGLAAEGNGPARAFDELAASMYERQSPGAGQVPHRGGRVTLRLRVRESTARFYRMVERGAAGLLPRGMSFMEYACLSVWAAWRHTLDPKIAYAQIYARDRHRCSCPVCGRRDVTPHHIKFRSRGGDDTDENVVAVCTECHLRLIHGGVITVEGRAGRLSWAIGRSGTLRVVGREKLSG